MTGRWPSGLVLRGQTKRDYFKKVDLKMARIDFLPNDYAQHRDSGRANFFYFVLLTTVMAGICITFSVIKVRQRAVAKELEGIKVRMAIAREQMELVEELQAKGKSMMKTASITMNLPDVVPKTIILAFLTNNLPDGVSLIDLKITDKEVVAVPVEKKSQTQYQSASNAISNSGKENVKSTKIVDTYIEITGIAPSDIEVANYIASVGNSFLLSNVGLIESKEYEVDKVKFRQFKLQAVMNHRAKLTAAEVEMLKSKHAENI